MKTFDQIEELKQNWISDPCWDIEETEGFEDEKRELKLFRMETEALWKERETKRQLERCERLGIYDNIKLLVFLESMENEIVKLREELRKKEFINNPSFG
jgi:hypothetical protein